MNDGRKVIAFVESQLSNFGLSPMRAAHELGYRTIFLSRDSNRYRGFSHSHEAFNEHIDQVIEIDTNAPDIVETALEPYSRRGELRGIATVTDYLVPIVAELAASFRLPGLSPAAARACRDKLLMREACHRHAVPVPRFRRVLDAVTAIETAEAFGFPCVVKPMTESASRGVVLCNTPGEVRWAFDSITSVTLDAFGQPRPLGSLVEEYVIGFELSVEFVYLHGRHELIGITDKLLGLHPYFVEIGHVFPSILSESVQSECTDLARRALTAVGHDFGAAHVEIKVTADGPRIIEINARMAGDDIAFLIRQASGIYFQREIIRLHAGDEPDISPTQGRAAAVRYLVAANDGILMAVTGAERTRRVSGVVEVAIEVEEGKRVNVPTSNLDVLGHVITVADTAGDAVRCVEAAIGQLTLSIR